MTWILHPHNPAVRADSYAEGSVCARQQAGHLLAALGTHLSGETLRKENISQRSSRHTPRQHDSFTFLARVANRETGTLVTFLMGPSLEVKEGDGSREGSLRL